MINAVPVYANKGYGSAGASTNRRSTKGFRAMSGSPREDIDQHNYTLRQRGRLMYMGAPIATSAIKTNRTNTIGLGLKLNPRPDVDALGLTADQSAEWVNQVKREFALWADKRDTCDATGMNNFYELQQMLMSSWLMSGDVFTLVQSRQGTKDKPYSLRLRAIEADRVATPTNSGLLSLQQTTGQNPKNGNLIYDGVEIDSSGMAVAYWIRNTYPFEASTEQVKFERVEAVGAKTGQPNIIQILSTERPDQYRGVSFLAPVIQQLLQLNRYTDSEITAAVIESYFTAFIKTQADDPSEMPYNETGAGYMEEEASYDPNEYEMGPGQINVMNPGESVELADPKRPASGFSAFVEAIATQIGAALEIPKEVLLKSFTASYSASRAALLEAWKSFNMYRTWFVNDFCIPVYELWMNEAVALGRVNAPGYFEDPAIKQAWLKAQWIGPSQGMLDPVKEITAEQMACESGFSTHADSTLRLNGSDYNSNIEQLAREKEKVEEFMGTPEGEKEEIDAKEDDADQRP